MTSRPKPRIGSPSATGMNVFRKTAFPPSALLGLDERRLLESIETSYIQSQSQSRREWMRVRVSRIERESSDVKSFYLTSVANRPFPNYAAGQHIAVSNRNLIQAEHSESPQIRCYTLSSAPNPTFWRISVKRKSFSPDETSSKQSLSNFLHDHVKVGDEILVKGPSGNFTLSQLGDAPMMLFAAGIGVTPMISMTYEAVCHNRNRPVWIFYQTQSPESAALSRELVQMVNESKAVNLTIAFSKLPGNQSSTDESRRITFVSGRISHEHLGHLAPFKESGHAYLCGPAKWMNDLRKSLNEQGVAPERIHFESFGGAAVTDEQLLPSNCSLNLNEGYNVALADSTKQFRYLPSAGTLLDQLQKAGADVAGGCRAGNCGTCMTRLLRGTVSQSSQHCEDLQDGWILPCIAQPTSEILLQL